MCVLSLPKSGCNARISRQVEEPRPDEERVQCIGVRPVRRSQPLKRYVEQIPDVMLCKSPSSVRTGDWMAVWWREQAGLQLQGQLWGTQTSAGQSQENDLCTDHSRYPRFERWYFRKHKRPCKLTHLQSEVGRGA